MTLSLIIVNYNTSTLLKECLKSINKGIGDMDREDTEIIVVDNGSTDGSSEIINNEFPNVIMISNEENIGFGSANNQAIKKAKGDYILLLNTDIKAEKNSISQLLKFCREKGNDSFIGGKLLNADGSPQASCGPFYSLWVTFLMLFFRGDKTNVTRYSPDTVKKVDWISGACMMAKRESFIKAGLFDENIFMYMDEIDLLFRAKQKGIPVYFYPQAIFYHLGSGSSEGKTEPVLNIYRGLLYFYHKYQPAWVGIILLIMLKLKALFALIIGTVTGNSYLKKTYGKALTLS